MINLGFALALFLESATWNHGDIYTWAELGTTPASYCEMYGEVMTENGDGQLFYSDDIATDLAIDDGYDYINYSFFAPELHVGDIVCTFEICDNLGECIARYDYVDYCPHQN